MNNPVVRTQNEDIKAEMDELASIVPKDWAIKEINIPDRMISVHKDYVVAVVICMTHSFKHDIIADIWITPVKNKGSTAEACGFVDQLSFVMKEHGWERIVNQVKMFTFVGYLNNAVCLKFVKNRVKKNEKKPI